ncbi:MAG TPA: FUSC family protein [Trebonia sp.]
MRSVGGGRLAVPRWLSPTVPDWLSEVVPDWLTEVVRPKKVKPPWGTMLRSVLAIWVPLAVGLLTGHAEIALLPAMGGLIGIMIDNGGTLRARVRRVGSATVFGGAVGIAVGSLIHGRGWIAVIVLVAVAAVSSLMSRFGGTGSVIGLQLMVYTAVSLGPLGELRPWWHTALGFIVGGAWSLVLLVPGWLLSPRGVEQRLVGGVYHAIAADLRAIGTPETAVAHRNVTAELNAAYDALLTWRAVSGGRSRRAMRLMGILNVSHQMVEAAGALRFEDAQPPELIPVLIDRLASTITEREAPRQLPPVPVAWSASPGALALREAMVSLTRVIAGDWSPPSASLVPSRPSLAERTRAQFATVEEDLLGGWIAWTFTIRLMLCTAVAGVVIEVAPLTRSYWVVLTVATVLKPDFGSVFARALQRGAGTVIGAVLGAVILALVPYGPWLLVPFGILAALLPYGKARHFGLSAVFLTPFVVLLIDLLDDTGWHLAGDRALDTVIGSAIVLLVGYAPWPVSWHARLPEQFAATLRTVTVYMTESLLPRGEDLPGTPAGAPGLGERATPRSRLRRRAFRSLADLRAEFQRAMSEPESVSRRARVWWPAVVGLEELLDAITANYLAVSRGAPAPAAKSVHRIAGTLTAIADAMEAGLPLVAGKLPDEPELRPLTDAAAGVLSALNPLPAEKEEAPTGVR